MKKKESDKYLKIVEWSEEDQCYVGSAPGLLIGGVHGKNQDRVFKALCEVVEETIQIMKKEKKPLPQETINKEFSGKIALRIPANLHKAIAIQALKEGESINKYIIHKLEHVL